jgi:hypothetical protein
VDLNINQSNNMKNEITHPLERYKRIADPTIRQQCIDNFDEEFYLDYCSRNPDDGSVQDAIINGFSFFKSEQGKGYWYKIAFGNTLHLLPEPIESLNESKLIVGADSYQTTLETLIAVQKETIDQLRSENEKLRECLEYYYNNARFSNYSVEEHLTATYQAKQLLNK